MTGRIGDRFSSLQTQRFLRLNQLRQQQAFTRLATGRRINSGADDPAGLIASERLSATLAALEAESRVIQRQQSMAATADGALGETSALLTEAKRLTVANADGTLSDAERQANQLQIDSIVASVSRISDTTTFNGQKLLDGSTTLGVTGASVSIANAGSGAIGSTTIDGETYTLSSLATGGSLQTNGPRNADAGAVIDKAINDISTQRARLGAYQTNVLATRGNSLGVAVENLSAARSITRDADVAAESAERFRSDALTAASLAVLATRTRSRGRLLTVV